MSPSRKHNQAFVDPKDGKLKITLEDGTIVVGKKKASRKTNYCEDIKDKIVLLGLKGMTPNRIAGEIGCTQLTMYRWMKKYPDLFAEYEAARAASAYEFEDKLLTLAEKTNHNDDVGPNRFKADIYMKLAQVRSPQVYQAKKQAQEGDVVKNVVINFVTGVPRAGEKSVVSVTTQPQVEEKQVADPDLPPDGVA